MIELCHLLELLPYALSRRGEGWTSDEHFTADGATGSSGVNRRREPAKNPARTECGGHRATQSGSASTIGRPFPPFPHRILKIPLMKNCSDEKLAVFQQTLIEFRKLLDEMIKASEEFPPASRPQD